MFKIDDNKMKETNDKKKDIFESVFSIQDDVVMKEKKKKTAIVWRHSRNNLNLMQKKKENNGQRRHKSGSHYAMHNQRPVINFIKRNQRFFLSRVYFFNPRWVYF